MNRAIRVSALCAVLLAACGTKDERPVTRAEPAQSAATATATETPTSAAPMTLCPASNPDKCDEIAEKLRGVDVGRARFAFGISCDARGLGGPRRAGCIDFKLRMVSERASGAALVDDSFLINTEEGMKLHGRMKFEVATANADVKASLAQTLTDHSRPFLECYRTARRVDPSLAGTVRLDALVDRFGGITMITPRTRVFDNREAVTCMVHCLAKYSVSPPPAEVTELTATLSFVPAP